MPGDAVLCSLSVDDPGHLWVLLAELDPVLRSGVWVNVTTRHASSDLTCVLHPVDHPFVHHESVLYYHFARVHAIADIEAALVQGTARLYPSCSGALLQRIRDGLVASPHTPKGIKQSCQTLWGIP